MATAATCQQLLADGVLTIGLNVERANTAAIRLYEGLGFTRVTTYEEARVTRVAPPPPGGAGARA